MHRVWSIAASAVTFHGCEELIPDTWVDFGSTGLTISFSSSSDEVIVLPAAMYVMSSIFNLAGLWSRIYVLLSRRAS